MEHGRGLWDVSQGASAQLQTWRWGSHTHMEKGVTLKLSKAASVEYWVHGRQFKLIYSYKFIVVHHFRYRNWGLEALSGPVPGQGHGSLGLSTQSVLWRWTQSCGRCLSHHALSFLELKSLQLRPKCCLSWFFGIRDRGRAHSRSEWFLNLYAGFPWYLGFGVSSSVPSFYIAFCPLRQANKSLVWLPITLLSGLSGLALCCHLGHSSLMMLRRSELPQVFVPVSSFIWTILVQQLLGELPHP